MSFALSNIVIGSGSGNAIKDSGIALNSIGGPSSNLASATTTISIGTASAPASNQVLTAISASNAIWSTPSAGGSAVYKSGVITRNFDAASGQVSTIAHGLGKTPLNVNVTGFVIWTTSTFISICQGSYNSSGNRCIGACLSVTTYLPSNWQDSTYSILLHGLSGFNGQGGIISVDATNIYITWTKIGGGANVDIQILWNATA
jgi:hypothetical protein